MAGNGWLVGEELKRFLDRHGQHFGDVLALEGDLERVPVVPLALAHLAGNIDIRKEVHLDLDRAVTLAGLTAPTLHIETEPTRLVTANVGLVGLGEQLADVVENSRVGGGVRTRGPPDRRLVDGDDLVELLHALDALVEAGRHLRGVDPLHQRAQQDLVDQGRLSGTGHARDTDELPERELDADVLQVVLLGTHNRDDVAVPRTTSTGYRDGAFPGQVLASDRFLVLEQLLVGAAMHDGAAVLAGTRTDVDNVIGDLHRVLVVLNDEDRVAEIAHPHERLDEPLVVALMQTDRGLVEDVQHADQTRTNLRRKPDSLGLATSEGCGVARHRQVIEANIKKEPEASVDLLEDLFGDDRVALVEFEFTEGLCRIGDRHRTEIADVVPVDRDRKRERVEPSTAADLTRYLTHVALDLLSGGVALGLVVAPHQIRDHALVTRLVGTRAAVPILVADLHASLHALAV